MSDALTGALRGLFPPEVSVAVEPVGDVSGMFPVEEAAVAKAVVKRQAEFAAGRRAARRAMSELGEAAVAIPKGESRAPEWPDGMMGSIAHDQGWAVAVVARSRDMRGLGVDLTEAAPLKEKLWPSIFCAGDMPEDGMAARAGFAAKEALYKAFYPSVGHFFGFDAAHVSIHDAGFEARLTRSLGPFGDGQVFTGQLAEIEGCLLASVVVTA